MMIYHIVSAQVATISLAAGLSIANSCACQPLLIPTKAAGTRETSSTHHRDKPWCNEFGRPNAGCHTPEPGSALID